MVYEGKFWPSGHDRQARTAIFHVPRSPQTDGYEGVSGGSTSITVTETVDEVESRLCGQFPAYRLMKYGENLIKRSVQDEV